jgi:hypothetical protein
MDTSFFARPKPDAQIALSPDHMEASHNGSCGREMESGPVSGLCQHRDNGSPPASDIATSRSVHRYRGEDHSYRQRECWPYPQDPVTHSHPHHPQKTLRPSERIRLEGPLNGRLAVVRAPDPDPRRSHRPPSSSGSANAGAMIRLPCCRVKTSLAHGNQ